MVWWASVRKMSPELVTYEKGAGGRNLRRLKNAVSLRAPASLEDMVGECDPAKTPPAAHDVTMALPM
jgi:hypothetical protein